MPLSMGRLLALSAKVDLCEKVTRDSNDNEEKRFIVLTFLRTNFGVNFIIPFFSQMGTPLLLNKGLA